MIDCHEINCGRLAFHRMIEKAAVVQFFEQRVMDLMRKLILLIYVAGEISSIFGNL